MDKVQFPFRSESHLPYLLVLGESGAWEKYGLEVEYNKYISSPDAHKFVADGSVEFVGGNHVSTYGARARGDKWVYLGQSVSNYNHRLIVRADSGISKVSDLKGKLIASKGQHPGGNTWLFIEQNGLSEERGDVNYLKIRGESCMKAVHEGKVDAAIVTPPEDLLAKRIGLKVIQLDPLPMVWFTTFSSGLSFTDKHPDIVDRFLKGAIEGTAYFKKNRDKSINIIQSKYNKEGKLDKEAATHLYDELARILETKPYASIKAVGNAYTLGVRQDKDALKVEPTALWDYHFLRKIDDSGFIDEVYSH